MELIPLVLVFTAWFFPAALGISVGRRASTRGFALLRAMLIAFGTAELAPLWIITLNPPLAVGSSGGLIIGMILFGLPPALLSGTIAFAMWKPRPGKRPRLSPALELAARARFIVPRKGINSDKVQAARQEFLERQIVDGFQQGRGNQPVPMQEDDKSDEAVIEEALAHLMHKLDSLPPDLRPLALEAMRDELRKQLQQMKQE